jgi:hypothetical protein
MTDGPKNLVRLFFFGVKILWITELRVLYGSNESGVSVCDHPLSFTAYEPMT